MGLMRTEGFMKCPLCHKTKFTQIGPVAFDKPSYYQNPHLTRCLGCGMVLVAPLPDESKLSRLYSGNYHYREIGFIDKLISIYNSKDLASDIGLIKKHIGGGRVLDIGAGRGDFLLRLPKAYRELWAFDPYLSGEDARALSKKIGSHVNDFKILTSYPNNYFDLVILRNVIEHTSYFKPLLKEIFRILRKGGMVFVRTPNIDSLEFRLFKNNWFVVRMSGHIVFFGKSTVKRVFKEVGFKNLALFPSEFAAPLSLYRSTNVKLPKIIMMSLSVIFSLVSISWKEGTDLRIIARK